MKIEKSVYLCLQDSTAPWTILPLTPSKRPPVREQDLLTLGTILPLYSQTASAHSVLR